MEYVQSLQLGLRRRPVSTVYNGSVKTRNAGGQGFLVSPHRWGTYTFPFETCRNIGRSQHKFRDTCGTAVLVLAH